MSITELTKDTNSWKSRKLVFSAATSLLIFLGAMLGAKWETFRPLYDAMVGGLLGVLGAYLGASITNMHVAGKAINASKSKTLVESGKPSEGDAPQE